MIAWSATKLKFTSGIGVLCTTAMMAGLSHQEMSIWLLLVIALLPLTVFMFVRPDEMRPSIVRPLQGFASAWYLLTVAVLTAWGFFKNEWPKGWPLFFIGEAVGCVPCVVVLKSLFWPAHERSGFRNLEDAAALKSDHLTGPFF